MFCVSCGNELPDGSRYCVKCGAPQAGQGDTAHRAPIAEVGGTQTRARGRTPLVIGLIVLALALAAIAVAFLVPRQNPDPQPPAATIPVQETLETGPGGFAIRDAVDDYSWDELGAIGGEIAQQPDRSSAIDVARSYHLVNEDGTLDGAQSKEVALADGSTASVRIVGFAHDAGPNGTAGITFAFEDAIGTHAWNENGSIAGGWSRSSLRSWMNGDLASRLPDDLSAHIVTVEKRSSIGDTPIASSDRMWAPSLVELVGRIDMGSYERAYGSIPSNQKGAFQGYFNTWNSEGDQYQLYRDQGTGLAASSDMLVMDDLADGGACSWWGRSTSDDQHVQSIDEAGVPHKSAASAGQTMGVIPFFCIGSANGLPGPGPEAATATGTNVENGSDSRTGTEALEEDRTLMAEDFARLYIANCEAVGGEVEGIPNRLERLLEYVEPGSSLEAELKARPRKQDGSFVESAAVVVRDTRVSNIEGDRYTVAVSFSATQGNRDNWLDDTNALMLHCTFGGNGEGLISEVVQDGAIRLTGSL